MVKKRKGGTMTTNPINDLDSAKVADQDETSKDTATIMLQRISADAVLRDLASVEWITDAPCMRLYVFMAGHRQYKDGMFRGMFIYRGCLWCSTTFVRSGLKLSQPTITGAFHRLEQKSEIARKRIGNDTIVALRRFMFPDVWESFVNSPVDEPLKPIDGCLPTKQPNDESCLPTKQHGCLPTKQPNDESCLATKQVGCLATKHKPFRDSHLEDNNQIENTIVVEEEEKKSTTTTTDGDGVVFDEHDYLMHVLGDPIYMHPLAKASGMSYRCAWDELDVIVAEWQATGKKHKDVGDCKRHLISVMRKIVEKNPSKGKNEDDFYYDMYGHFPPMEEQSNPF